MSNDSPAPAHLHLNTYSDKPNMRVCFIQGASGQHPGTLPTTATHRVAAPIVFSFNEVSELDDDSGGGCGDDALRTNLKLNQSYDLVFYEDDIKGIRWVIGLAAPVFSRRIIPRNSSCILS